MQRCPRKRTAIAAAVLFSAGITGCSHPRDTSQTVSEVRQRIASDQRLTSGRFQVTGSNRVITLSGYVTNEEQRRAAVRDSQQVEGVRVVVDNLRLAAPSLVSLLVTPVREPQSITIAPAKPASSLKQRATAETAARGKAASDVPLLPVPDVDAPPVPQGNNAVAANGVPASTSSPEAPAAVGSSAATGAASISPPRVLAAPQSPPEKITLPYGTMLAVRLTESLSSELNEKGDTFLGSLASPVRVGDRVVVPEGAGIKGRVIEAQSAGRFSGRPMLAIEVTRLGYNGESYDLRTSRYSSWARRAMCVRRPRLAEVPAWARFLAESWAEGRGPLSAP